MRNLLIINILNKKATFKKKVAFFIGLNKTVLRQNDTPSVFDGKIAYKIIFSSKIIVA